MAKTELKTASVLAFERKLDPSDATFSAGRWDERDKASQWPAINVREKSVRGTISNRLKGGAQDPAKLDAEIQKPNLQTVDVATLPSNIANGRFLWRNRVGAEQVEVHVSHIEQGEIAGQWVFNAHDFSLRNFDADKNTSLAAMAAVIEQGLSSRDGYALLDIQAFARMGDAQEVYPSQELILDRGDKKGQKSKTLYVVDGVAGMHSQKIGNALRTIDTWYPTEEGMIGPIAVEPYGSVTSEGKAYRQPKAKADFYNLLDNWVLKGQAPGEGDQHYVMATLVRGGVFGASDKD